MSAPKFTKGPWGFKGGPVKKGQWGWIERLHPELKVSMMPITEYRPLVGDLDEIISNAHLIAAAPELYAELERIDPNNPILAKARGETK